jgi:hypothetical protein
MVAKRQARLLLKRLRQNLLKRLIPLIKNARDEEELKRITIAEDTS